MKKMKTKNDFELLREKVDSDEEVYFIWWMEELYLAGYILKYYRANTYELSSPVKRPIKVQLKTKVKDSDEHIFHKADYTPDFVIEWTDKAIGVFVTDINGYEKKETIFYHEGMKTTIEIKGMFDRNNMIRLVTTNIKWVYEKFYVHIHLVKMPKLFKDTFTPTRYLKTNKSGSSRSIKWKIINLENYTKTKCKNIGTALELFQ